MKIKVRDISYEKLEKIDAPTHRTPKRQSRFVRSLMAYLSQKELKEIHFTCKKEGMEKIKEEEPCLILMNHSSFTDLQIVAELFKKRPYHIVCTNDGFVGKGWVLRKLGCLSTKKFIPEVTLVKDMNYVLTQLRESVLMFPEASYSFDGTETPLPKSLGKCLKILNVPVIMVRTYGAFGRDPLYNGLQKRQVDVSAKMYCLLTVNEIREKTVQELNDILAEAFSYDHFREQKERKILVRETFRADGLHRVLYKCDSCMAEGDMEGKNTKIICTRCGREHELLEDGTLKAASGKTRFSYVSDWYTWERNCVREEIEKNIYGMEWDVKILALKDEKQMYRIGEGHLSHAEEGFHLTGCDGKLDFRRSARSMYSLYADYFWYEIGDMISIGDDKIQYYCFPKNSDAIVAKARLASEEMARQHEEKRLKQA